MSEWIIREKFNLPQNWEIFRLKDLTTQIVDGTHFTPNYLESGIPFLRVTDIQTDKINFEKLKFISKEEHDILKLRCFPKRGDILVSKNGSIGIIKIVDWEWEFSIFVSLALLKTKQGIYNHYLKYLLQSEIVWWQIKLRAKQGTVTNLHLEEIRELEIPKPPLTEQTHIAKILSTADAVIEKTEAAIAKYKAIKQGMLQDLFTRGIDLTTNKLRVRYEDAPHLYKESKLGMIPREWEVERIDTLCKITTGGKDTQNKEDHGEYPFFVRSQTIEKISSYSYDGEAILTSGDGVGVGKIYHYINGKFDFHQRVYMLYEFEKIIAPKFLFYYFSNNFLAEVDKYSAKNTVDSVRMEMIAGMIVTLPNISEQINIAEKLITLDNKLQTEQTYLQKMQLLKKGLMEDLLSGKKQVKVKEELVTQNGI